MARPIYKYQPKNETPDSAIGIAYPFNVGGKAQSDTAHYASGSIGGNSVFKSTYTTQEQVISNFKNLLLTRKGERLMQPNFGTNIYSMLFENNTKNIRSSIEESLIEDVQYWLPYITINDIKTSTSTDMHELTISIHFQITNIGSNLVINVLASENNLQISTVEEDTSVELRQITNGY